MQPQDLPVLLNLGIRGPCLVPFFILTKLNTLTGIHLPLAIILMPRNLISLSLGPSKALRLVHTLAFLAIVLTSANVLAKAYLHMKPRATNSLGLMSVRAVLLAHVRLLFLILRDAIHCNLACWLLALAKGLGHIDIGLSAIPSELVVGRTSAIPSRGQVV